jgi:hypothetical protein
MPSPIDITLVVLTILLPVLYLYRNSIPFINSPKDAANTVNSIGGKVASVVVDEGDPRDWVAKMEKNVSLRAHWNGSEAWLTMDRTSPSQPRRTNDAPCFTDLRLELPRNTLFG